MKNLRCLSRALPVLAHLWVLLLVAGPAAAQSPAAQETPPGAAEPAGDSDPAERGKQLFATGQYRESIEALKAAYAAAPRPKLYYNIAICYVKLNEPFEAITYLRLFQTEAAGLPPDQQRAISIQIDELRKQLGHPKAGLPAAATVDAGRSVQPEAPVLVAPSSPPAPKQTAAQKAAAAKKELAANQELADKAATAEKESTDRYDAAREFYAAGRYQEAIVELKSSYALAPRPKLYFNVGMCYMKLKQPFEAIAYFQRYLGEAPDVTPEKTAEINGYVAELRARLHPVTEQTPVAAAPSAATSGIAAPSHRDLPVPLYKRAWFWGVTIGAVVVVATAISVPVALAQPKSLCDGVDSCIRTMLTVSR